MSAKVSTFSRGGSTTTVVGEITRELVNASDGQGLHFDGAAGNIDIASRPLLGTKFSFEFVIQATTFGSAQVNLIDFGSANRFVIYSHPTTSELTVISDSSSDSFGVAVLDDLKVHHLVFTVDGTSGILYDNGSQVGEVTITVPTLDLATAARIGTKYDESGSFFNGTIYRARLWNKTLTAAEVTASYENATVPFSDQYGSQTNKITAAVDKNWGTAQADTGVDATDRATFNTNYAWVLSGTPKDISVASNLLQFTTTSANHGIYYPGVLTANKKYRVTLKTGTITGDGFKVMQYDGSLNDIGTLVASTTNIFEFTADASTNGNLLVLGIGSGTIQLDAASVSNSSVEIGCVADYDLAFANPTQSTMVQDRAGAADGTSSATGVTQVTPIVQLNATAARIGTSAATPADGEIKANALTIDTTVTGGAVIDASGQTGTTARLELKADRPSADQDSCDIRFYNNNAAPIAHITAVKGSGANDTDGKLDFYTSNSKALTIGSAGLATFSAGIVSSAMPTSDPSVAGQLWNDSGTVKISAG